MNYEVLIWLERPASGLFSACVMIAVIAGITYATGLILSIIFSNNDYEIANFRHAKALRKISRNIFLISFPLAILLNPIANFSYTYKQVLIYRGINSVLADKSIQTADKALDLLNMKIDKELEKLGSNP